MRTTRRRNADGSVVEYNQRAENIWDAAKGCAVARVVSNFGRADQRDPAALRRLARSILRIVSTEEARAADPDVRLLDAWPSGGCTCSLGFCSSHARTALCTPPFQCTTKGVVCCRVESHDDLLDDRPDVRTILFLSATGKRSLDHLLEAVPEREDRLAVVRLKRPCRVLALGQCRVHVLDLPERRIPPSLELRRHEAVARVHFVVLLARAPGCVLELLG